MIWMEDITHATSRGNSLFTLSSTNKLLKWYPYTTGLKTGSTSKAKYCISATAKKDELSMIAVVLGAEDPKKRFQDAQTLLAYGFGISDIYIDENDQPLPLYGVEGGVQDTVFLKYEKAFRYLDTTGKRLDQIEKQVFVEEPLQAPLEEGQPVGMAVYTLQGKEIGSVNILCGETIERAKYKDYLLRSFEHFLLGESVVQ
jgi:D-alanyl-D-alanine carboxypeptidase (penicillin-binding protein 5/6)